MNMIENAGMFRGNRIIEIFPQRMDRKGTNGDTGGSMEKTSEKYISRRVHIIANIA